MGTEVDQEKKIRVIYKKDGGDWQCRDGRGKSKKWLKEYDNQPTSWKDWKGSSDDPKTKFECSRYAKCSNGHEVFIKKAGELWRTHNKNPVGTKCQHSYGWTEPVNSLGRTGKATVKNSEEVKCGGKIKLL